MCILGIIICINCVWGTNVKLFEISKYTHPSSESMELLKFLWETSLKIKGFWGEGPEPSWKNTPRLHFILAATSWEGLQKDQPTHWALPVFIPTDWPAVDGVCWNRSNWLLCDCPQKSCLIFLISPSTQYLWNIWNKYQWLNPFKSRIVNRIYNNNFRCIQKFFKIHIDCRKLILVFLRT